MTVNRIINGHISETIKAPEAPAHPSVAHVRLNAMAYAESAEAAMAHGCPMIALYQIGVAEGIAMALQAVAGYTEGVREHTVLRTVLQKMLVLRCEAARRNNESPT